MLKSVSAAATSAFVFAGATGILDQGLDYLEGEPGAGSKRKPRRCGAPGPAWEYSWLVHQRYDHIRRLFALDDSEAGDGAVTAEKCKECGQPLVEVDNRGQHLRGCLTCNLWQNSAGNVVKLSVEDLAALHAIRRTK